MEIENKEVVQEEQVKNDVQTSEEAPKTEGQEASKENKGGRKPFNKGGKKPFNKRDRRNEPKEFEERVVYLNRVTKVVKGGKRMKFSALVVIGNGKGKYGFATGKSGEVPDAIKKAVEAAKHNTKLIHIAKASSITHDVVGKFGATSVFLKPAPEGTGIIAGGPVRAVLELTGIRNVYSKVYGSRTAINIIRATDNALLQLKNKKHVDELRSTAKEEE